MNADVSHTRADFEEKVCPSTRSLETIVAFFDVKSSLQNLLRAAQIAPVVLVSPVRLHQFTLFGEPEVERDDGEGTFFMHDREDAWGKDMNPAEGERLCCACLADHFGFASETRATAAEPTILVKKKIARCCTVLDGKSRQSVVLFVEMDHLNEVDSADNVDVMDEEWLVGIAKKRCSLFESASGIEEVIFIGDFDVHSEVFMASKVCGNHIREVMGIDDDIVNAEGAKPG